MKKHSVLLTLALIMLLFIGCMPENNNPANNNDNELTKEDEKREKDNDDYLMDKERFKSEYSYKIGYNEGRIAEIKSNLNKSDKDYADKSQKIDELEKKNRELKDRLDKPDGQTQERWEEFKKEFRHDAEALGDALKGFFKDDKKEG